MLSRVMGRAFPLTLFWMALSFLGSGQSFAQQVNGQVSSDGTTGTVVSGTSPFSITEGTLRTAGSDTLLFHSFDHFSPAAAGVVFDLKDAQNAIDTSTITTIIGRITGEGVSFIDGQLSIDQDQGTPTPDLFLINPNGIAFGENANLSLPGSFVASTADALLFSDGAVFTTDTGSGVPLLTVSGPIGLQFGSSAPSAITLHGTGHQIATTNPTFEPYFPTGANSGLGVAVGQTLSFIGGSLALDGGVLSASEGYVDLGGVVEGTVVLTDLQAPTAFDYSDVQQWGDVSLSGRSLVDVSGAAPGAIRVHGQDIQISEGSLLWDQNRLFDPSLSFPSGEIAVTAANQLILTGTTPTLDAVSGIITESIGLGAASNIQTKADELIVDAGATLGSRAFAIGDSGRIEIETERTHIDGYAAIAPNVFSAVGTSTAAASNAREIVVSSQDLFVTNGGYLGSTTLGTGRGGDVAVMADRVEVIGATPADIASIISATTVGNEGDSGDVVVKTRTLRLQDSGLVSTSNIGVGNAGNILVEASERIDISGGLPNLPNSTIASTVDFPPLALQMLLGLSGQPQGSAGNVTVSTPLLNVSDRGTVTVANIAAGDAGELVINADRIVLNSSSIDAFTLAGNGGNILLNVQDSLLMRGNSRINAISGGDGNGGNLRIESPIIIGIENSDIIASAVTGNGGNIDIQTQAILGLALRSQETPENDITASSQFGLSGTINIEGFTLSADAGLTELPQTMSDASRLVAESCAAGQGNQFIASGRGGLPENPVLRLASSNVWTDVRSVESAISSVEGAVSTHLDAASNLQEATHLQQTETGEIVLAANTSSHYAADASCLLSD